MWDHSAMNSAVEDVLDNALTVKYVGRVKKLFYSHISRQARELLHYERIEDYDLEIFYLWLLGQQKNLLLPTVCASGSPKKALL